METEKENLSQKKINNNNNTTTTPARVTRATQQS
jgi:hypothetical protein